MAGREVFVRTESLIERADRLNAEATEKAAKRIPKKIGSGAMINKIADMVENMNKLHEKSIELIADCSSMLEKMGYKFEETDQNAANIYKFVK